MQTQLPRRPFIELPPPSGGLATARQEASRRRTRRTVAGIGGAVTAAVVGAVVLLAGGGSDISVLRPAPVTPATQLPSPGRALAPSSAPVGTHGGGVAHPAPSRGERGTPAPAGSPGSSSRSAGPSRTSAGGRADSTAVTVTRTSGRYTGGPEVCRTGYRGDNSGVNPGDDWCPTVSAVAVDGGERLSYTVCRDSTTGGTLHFSGSREVEFRVVRGSATVWRFSAHVAETSSPHALTAAADDCWTWSLVWPRVDDAGAVAPAGQYTLEATSTAQEFVGAPVTSGSFAY